MFLQLGDHLTKKNFFLSNSLVFYRICSLEFNWVGASLCLLKTTCSYAEYCEWDMLRQLQWQNHLRYPVVGCLFINFRDHFLSFAWASLALQQSGSICMIYIFCISHASLHMLWRRMYPSYWINAGPVLWFTEHSSSEVIKIMINKNTID